jgi:hypothetical protein
MGATEYIPIPKWRQNVGLCVFFVMLLPYSFAMILEFVGKSANGLAIRFQCACEATVCAIIDGEQWQAAYAREYEAEVNLAAWMLHERE